MSRELQEALPSEKEVFLEALDLEADRRAAYLNRIFAGRPDLRERVERLLEAQGEATFLERPVRLTCAEPRQPHSLEGTRLGPYRVVREIGRGGMGSVYLAERADDAFERRVAIKIVRPEVLTAQSGERFLKERQILARLDHPGIARLIDGGTIPKSTKGRGSAYFVLEYVDGLPIDRYCREQDLTLRERLVLVRKVCAAVHFAHRNLVVHQDLKPSNILVTADGEPKLLDFGIARMLRREGVQIDPTSPYAALTPGYASPEQVRGEGITTASDIYSLGILLYEVLAGCHPYRGRGHNPEEPLTPEAWLRAVCQDEPEPPSMAALDRGIGRELAGDLDTVILKAMAKEPADRYPSVEHLAEDVRRFLEGFPVMARPVSPGERLGKLARRHPLAAAALAGVAVAVLAVILLAFLLESRNRQLERQRAVAEEVSTFATGLFQLAEPGTTEAGRLSAQKLLEEGEQKVYRELAGQPPTQAKMLDVLGMAYFRLTLFDRARDVLEEAVRLRQEAPREEPLALAESRFRLAEALRRLRDHEGAEPLYRQALAVRQEALGEIHEGVAEVLAGLGELLIVTEGPEVAEPILEKALAMSLETVGETSPQVANILYQLAAVAERRRDFEISGKLFERARALTQETLGTGHLQYAQCLYGLGVYHFDTGDLETGGRYLEQALELQERLLAPGDYRLVQTLTNLGFFHSLRGRSALAVEILRRAIQEALIHHRDQPLVERIRLGLASVLLDRGGLEEARALLEEVQHRAEEKPDHPYLSSGQGDRLEAYLLILEGDPEAAESLARRILSRVKEQSNPVEQETFATQRLLGEALLRLGRLEEAAVAFEEAAKGYATLPEDHPLRLLTLGSRIELALAADAPREALALLRRAREVAPKSIAVDPAETAWYQGAEGEALARLGETAAAEPLLRESHRRFVELLGEAAPAVAEAERRLRLLNGEKAQSEAKSSL